MVVAGYLGTLGLLPDPVYKLSHRIGDEWLELSWPATFAREAGPGAERLIFGVPAGDTDVLRGLLGCVDEPLFLLYLLHTPRGEGQPGRYRSPELSRFQVEAFLSKYCGFLRGDARYDLWLHSPASNATIVWDRHNLAYAYGPIECFTSALLALGFALGSRLTVPEHAHHYRAELDTDAASVLGEFAWRHSELRPGDEQ